MAVRAVRGAIQLDHDDRDHLLAGVTDLIKAVLEQNNLAVDDLISMLFTATPDLHSEFPALAARELGIVDVPLMCAAEIDVVGAMPRVVRLLAHVDTLRGKNEIQHVYLGGAAALRKDIAQ
ncbi:chorismate mutase [Catenulispora yoronensis]|uniref:chorismate mutase n=1 Tax=Catenulispora yoronensis TaxID=450799 RepID=A0ABN2VAL4_9ACTN